MKNLLIRYINVISLLGFFAFVMPATLTLNNKEIAIKLQIETNLEEKVTNVISKVYDVNRFAVTTNVVLLPINSNLNNNQTAQSFGTLELEGILPAVPSTSSDSGVIVDDNDYRVQIKDITIWLDSDLNVINAKNEITPYIFDAMDWLANCENCIQFKSMKFPDSNSMSTSNNTGIDNEDLKIIEENIEYILSQIDKLTEESDAEANQWMIDYLSRTLEEQKIENKELLTKVLDVQQGALTADSAMKIELVTSNKEIAIKAIDANMEVTTAAAKAPEEDADDGETLLWAVLFILIGILILLIVLDKRGPKTVYLKPKDKNSDNKTEASITNKNSEGPQTESSGATNQSSQATQALDPTGAYADDSVVQSDLKSMKQSAVKMSVGQQQGASQIVQDWLDDGGDNSGGDNQDSNEEESNG